MLDFIYYPVSFILWCWHWVFGHVFGDSSGIAWALGIMFLVFTLRAIMFKPFVKQVRSMRAMQEFAPEMKKIQKKYANDRQRQAQEMQKLQREHGFSPLGGCLPMLLQIPVFIGLYHVLRSFQPGHTENYFFDEQGVASYIDANIFGARLSNFITQPQAALDALGADRTAVIIVSIPLMVLAAALTHLTARHSVTRQNPEAATSQTAIMNKLTLYIFPLGVLVFGFFFPIGLLLYWLANNTWTLAQQRIVYRRIDAEEEQKKSEAIEKRSNLAPKPGQRPNQAKRRPAGTQQSGTKPAGTAKPSGTTKPSDTTKPGGTAKSSTAKPGTTKSGGTAKPGIAKPGTAKPGTAKPAGETKPAGNTPGSSGNGAADKTAGDGSTVSGLGADRSRKKNTGRKNR
ncbi:MAG: membrane protein insertase YidC [Actinophytocola sp.]|uniref:membrane protein insertase YidC n=1 Tax=Actinophytocola sp. TaxID=1872138 RepID=UPI003D6AFB18